MTKSQKTVVAIAVVGLVAALGVGGFLVAFEKVDTQVWEPPSGPARQNPYLGAQRLLGRLGYAAETVSTLTRPSADTDIVILASPSRDFSPQQVHRWTTWVSSGGHLIVAQAAGAGDSHAPVLEQLGLHYEPSDRDGKTTANNADDEDHTGADDGNQANADAGNAAQGAQTHDKTDHARSNDTAQHYQIEAAGPLLSWLAADADWVAHCRDDHRFALSRPTASGGRITVFRTNEIFTNTSVGQAQHATLLADMVALDGPPKANVTLVKYNQRQSWLMYVLGYTWPFFLVGLVILALAVAGGRRRFGPKLADQTGSRRSRLAHIDATGRFLWKYDSVAHLLEAAQQALVGQLEQRRPALGEATGSERDQIIADELGISTGQVHRLLSAASGGNADQFIARIRTLEQHRRNL